MDVLTGLLNGLLLYVVLLGILGGINAGAATMVPTLRRWIVSQPFLELCVGWIDGERDACGIRDALVVGNTLAIPGLQPEKDSLARVVPLPDEAFEVGPLLAVGLVVSVGALPFVVDDDCAWMEAVRRQARDDAESDEEDYLRPPGELANVSTTPLSIADIAAARRIDGADAFLDIALEDGLDALFDFPVLNQDPEAVRPLVTDPRFLIGLSDAGAHVDMLCNAGYPTYLLGYFAHGKQSITLEHAIKRITSEPARFFGMSDRGELRPGMAADITIFDFDRIGSPERPEIRHDFPGGGRRLVTQATGVEYTIVNGTVLYEGQRHTGVLPGRVLRCGQPMA